MPSYHVTFLQSQINQQLLHLTSSTSAHTRHPMEATATESSKTAPEAGNNTSRSPAGPPPNYFRVDFLLRLLLLASAVSALVVLVTSKQTKRIPTGLTGAFAFVDRDAKLNYSPAFM
jgi:hypothetical protein